MLCCDFVLFRFVKVVLDIFRDLTVSDSLLVAVCLLETVLSLSWLSFLFAQMVYS